MLCDNLEGLGWEMQGRFKREGPQSQTQLMQLSSSSSTFHFGSILCYSQFFLSDSQVQCLFSDFF